MKLPDIKKLIQLNNIKGTSHLNKPELIGVLIKSEVLPSDYVDKPPKVQKCPRLESIRNQARAVEVHDRKTGEVATYKSIYACAKKIGVCSGLIHYYDGKVLGDRYEIKLHTS